MHLCCAQYPSLGEASRCLWWRKSAAASECSASPNTTETRLRTKFKNASADRVPWALNNQDLHSSPRALRVVISVMKLPIVVTSALAFGYVLTEYGTVEEARFQAEDVGSSLACFAQLWWLTQAMNYLLGCVAHVLGEFQNHGVAKDFRSVIKNSTLYLNILGCCFLSSYLLSLHGYGDACWKIVLLLTLAPLSCLVCPEWLWPGSQLLCDVFVVLSCCFLGMIAVDSSNMSLWLGSVYLGSAVLMFGVNSGALFYAVSALANRKFFEGILLSVEEEAVEDDFGDT